MKALIDYIGADPLKCVTGQITPAMYASSFRYVPGDSFLDHPVDTNVGIGGDPTGQRPIWMTDTHLGVTYNTSRLYSTIQSSRYKTYTTTPGTHCESINNAAYLPAVFDKIRKGLGI